MAKKRLDYLQKQLTKNQSLFTDRDKAIEKYLKEGIVEDVENNNSKVTSRQVHYLPHRTIIRENKVTYCNRRVIKSKRGTLFK